MQSVQKAAGMSTSASGTVQTHVSSHGSYRRLNTSSSLGTLTATTQGKTLATNPHTKQLDITNGRPRDMIHLYKLLQRLALILLVLFSVYRFTCSVTLPHMMRYFYPKSPVFVTSPLDSMPQAYRLSRLTHLPNPEEFESVYNLAVEPYIRRRMIQPRAYVWTIMTSTPLSNGHRNGLVSSFLNQKSESLTSPRQLVCGYND
jgi:hypothetical protein